MFSADTELLFYKRLQLLQLEGIEPLMPPDDAIVLIQEHEGWKGVDAELSSHWAGGGSTAQQ